MENGKQIQKAGENSQQIQAQTVIVNQGISEERVRTIFSEMIPYTLQEYTCDAYTVASQRIGRLESYILPKLDKVDGLLQAFADPAFQILLRKAQQASAATEREDDYAILSELLVCHVQKGNNRKNRAGITRAIEIIDQIDNDALCALTAAHTIVQGYTPNTGDCKKGLQLLNSTFQQLIYQELPNGAAWLDHLDILNAVRISPYGKMLKFSEGYTTLLNGYACAGIKANSDDYQKAAELLANAQISLKFLIPNECLDGFFRLNIRGESSIETLTFGSGATAIPLTEDQKNAIRSVWKLYSKDFNLCRQAKNNFMRLWDSYESLYKLRIWWENIPNAFEITRVGQIVAHTNAKRCSPYIPDLI